MTPDFLICSAAFSAYLDGGVMAECVRPVVDPVVVTRPGFSAVLPQNRTLTEMDDGKHELFVSGALMSPEYFISHALTSRSVNYAKLLSDVKKPGGRDDLSGVFCLVSITESSFELYTDPLGQFPLFNYRDGSDWVVSSDPWAIVALLRRKGIEVERDCEAVSMAMVYGTTFGERTGFKNVALIKANQVWLGDKGVIRDNGDTYLSDIFLSVNYRKYLSETAEVMAGCVGTAVKALKALSYNCVSDLTGGMDSRLTTSLLVAAGCDKDVGMFSLGKRPRPDRMVADYLIDKYGWMPGVLVRSGGEEVTNYHELYNQAVFRSFGMKLSEFPDLSSTYVDKMARITGYYGEFSRIFYDKYLGLGDDKIVEAFVRGSKGAHLTKAAIEAFSKAVRAALKEYGRCGLKGSARLRALYLENRSKIHFGMAVHSADRGRLGIHPLNSVRLLRLGNSLDDKQCMNNKVCFDLICKLVGKKFALEPMADKFWDASLFRWRMSRKEARRRVIRPRSVLESTPSGIRSVVASPPRTSPKRLDPEFAAEMSRKGKPYYWAALPDSLEVIKLNMRELPEDHELFDYIDRDSVLATLEQGVGSIESGGVAKNTLRLAVLLIWAGKQETASRILNWVNAREVA